MLHIYTTKAPTFRCHSSQVQLCQGVGLELGLTGLNYITFHLCPYRESNVGSFSKFTVSYFKNTNHVSLQLSDVLRNFSATATSRYLVIISIFRTLFHKTSACAYSHSLLHHLPRSGLQQVYNDIVVEEATTVVVVMGSRDV